MIIDCHGHYTTIPQAVGAWRDAQKDAASNGQPAPDPQDRRFQISDDEIRDSVEHSQ
jgi:4-oxalmesaconate hydratase